MSQCTGNTPEHCCYVDGAICQFLEEDTIPGRHWVCGLRRELGSWDLVHHDPRYQHAVQPMWSRLAPGKGCGDWPLDTCASCGVTHG